MQQMSLQFIFTIITIIVFTHQIVSGIAGSPPVVLWHGMGKKIIIFRKIVLKYRYILLG